MEFGQLWFVLELCFALAWLAALAAGWHGRWNFAGVVIAASLFWNLATVIGVFALPRSFFGSLGAGDAFGLIGLLIYCGIAVGVTAAAAVVTMIVYFMRRRAVTMT